MKIISVVGARPNFMKIAPFVKELERNQVKHCLVHTGQHYDEAMSKSFFDALGIPKPDIDLGIGSGTHAEQVGRTMIEFEKVVREWKPDLIVVAGDVNATCACSIVAKKERILLAHIEAGLRSFDLRMPEEINRMVTDRLADILFVTSSFARDNLLAEGVSENRIKVVGNIMIDTLEAHRTKAKQISIDHITTFDESQRDQMRSHGFAVLTLHRPSNVDSRDALESWVRFFVDQIACEMLLVWVLHPRTKKMLEKYALIDELHHFKGLILVDPLGYHEMLKLNMEAKIMFTDSGGLQEECCILGTTCITLRENTERPVTLQENGGVSILVGSDKRKAKEAFVAARAKTCEPYRPPAWDGKAAERIVKEIFQYRA